MLRWGILLTSFVMAAVVVVGCGGGGGGGTPGTANVLTFNGAASVGDLLTYTLNPSTLEYAYSILEPASARTTGAGVLTPVSGFGQYVYTTSDNDTVLLFPNNLCLVAPRDGDGLIAGVPTLSTNYSTSGLAGDYNYVNAHVYGTNCDSDHGTFRVDAGGTWSAWSQSNFVGVADETGTWVDQGNGIIYIYQNFGAGDVKVGHLMVLPGTSGGKLLVVDHYCTVAGNEKYGITLGTKQRTLSVGDLQGTLTVLDSDENAPYTVVISGTQVTSPGGTATWNLNSPWIGFAQDPVSLALPTVDGIIFGGNSTSIFAGVKQQ